MKLPRPQPRGGIALIIVMIAVFVLSMLVGAFAYAMKVETTLARNARNDGELIWLGRSGVELARYAVAMQLTVTTEDCDALHQVWAGGTGGIAASNSPLVNLSLQDVRLGNGTIRKVTITDLERKININTADSSVLLRALTYMGVDASEAPAIGDAILDWIDRDSAAHINGAESDYYQSMDPPYFAKNGPIDDLSELLLVRGVTHEMFWGPAADSHAPAFFQPVRRLEEAFERPSYSLGLVDIFTPMSTRKINLNTASVELLTLLVDDAFATTILQLRRGPDGVDGTDDDTPIQRGGVRDALLTATGSRQAAEQLAPFFDGRCATYEVQVEAEVGGHSRSFYATLGRASEREVQVLSFYWKE